MVLSNDQIVFQHLIAIQNSFNAHDTYNSGAQLKISCKMYKRVDPCILKLKRDQKKKLTLVVILRHNFIKLYLKLEKQRFLNSFHKSSN